MEEKLNLLFVCSRNQWCSPTAERVFRDSFRFNVRSGGTSSSARRRASARDIDWADVILVMESRHRDALREMFGQRAREAEILILGIPDEYQFMDPELVDQLRARVDELLNPGFSTNLSWRTKSATSPTSLGNQRECGLPNNQTGVSQ